MRNSDRPYAFFVRFPLLAACSAFLLMGVFAKRGALDWLRMNRENRVLVAEMAEMKSQREELERRISAFRSDRETQKRVVRQALGYVAKDEIVVEFD